MAYHISVDTKAADGGTIRELYHNPLGTGSQVDEYWFRPARAIGLTFFDTHFDDHMEVSGDDLDLLASDLDRLEQHWVASGIAATARQDYVIGHLDGTREEGDMPMLEHLRTRLGYLREAIHIAKESGAVLSVG